MDSVVEAVAHGVLQPLRRILALSSWVVTRSAERARFGSAQEVIVK